MGREFDTYDNIMREACTGLWSYSRAAQFLIGPAAYALMEVEKEHVKHETGSPFYWGTTETWVSGLQLLFDIMAGPEFKDALSDAIGFLDGNHPDMLFEEIVRRRADNGWWSGICSLCQTRGCDQYLCL